MSYNEVPLKDLLGGKGYIRGPFGSALKRSELKEEGIPVYEQQHAIRGDRDFRYYIDEEKYEKLKRFTVETNDLIISCSGTVGRISVIREEDPKGIISQALLILRPDADKILPAYLFYFFTSKQGFGELINASQGAVQLNIAPRAVVEKIPVPTPSIDEQKEIINKLKTLDGKIQLNRQTNQTLEQIAQAIFKSWFVDFEPVMAKIAAKQNDQDPELAAVCAISGKTEEQLNGLDAAALQQLKATAALFPDALVESELVEVPEGWGVSVLKELTSKIGSGATPRGGSKSYIDEGVTFIRSQNIYDSEFKWDGLVCINDVAAERLKAVSVEKDDVLINITGASILRTSIVEPSILPARVNQHVAIIRAKKNVSPRFIHLHLLREKTKEYLLGLNAGGSREAVTKGHLESVPIVYPGETLMQEFQYLVGPLYDQIEQKVIESRGLAHLRDTLLPKLLSGELETNSVA